MQKSTNIVVVERALKILQLISEHNKSIGVTEISENLQFPKSAIHRILRTLEDFHFVIQESDSKLYLLGPGVLKLSDGVRIEPTLEAIGQPHLELLAQQTSEVANLGFIKNNQVLVVQSVSGRSNSRLMARLGTVAEIHCSSLGKAILAYKSSEEILSIVGQGPFPRFTSNTKTTLKELINELKNVRKTGISIDNEETEEGLICYGAPVFDWNKESIAAISVSAPLARMKDQRSENAKMLVTQASINITKLVVGLRK